MKGDFYVFMQDNPTRYRYTTVAGTAIRVLSKRSSIPPCPGRILPESLMPGVVSSAIRSGHPMFRILLQSVPVQSILHQCSGMPRSAKRCFVMMLNTAPPIEPSKISLVKYVSNIGGVFPNSMPVQAPVSFTQLKIKWTKGSIGLYWRYAFCCAAVVSQYVEQKRMIRQYISGSSWHMPSYWAD